VANEQKHDKLERVLNNIDQVIIGKREVAELSLVSLLAGGHVLLEDVPGVGKTVLVKALAKSIGATFKRIQFTPDLLPSDVTGMSIFNPKEQAFIFRPGPIMGHIILADEINRTSPKTQSALLEGMEEASVTIDGETRRLEKPFFVMATQNPIEHEGTYPLPEAQLDRFLLKMKMGYPTAEEEMEVLRRAQYNPPLEDLQSVLSLEELLQLQSEVQRVLVDDNLKAYMIELAIRTRNDDRIDLGVSPRASIALMKAAQAYAFLNSRDYVVPDDIQYLVSFVFAHRLILKPEVRYEEVNSEFLIHEIVATTPVPVKRVIS
jgi:MoxR-like ATPase